MQVVSINELNDKKRKKNLLEVVDYLRNQIEEGKIEEFVVASMNTEGEVSIHANIKDLVGGIGLFEIGKNILIQQQNLINYE